MAYFASLREAAISAIQPGPYTARSMLVSRGADNCHIPRQGPAAFKRHQRKTIWSLAVLAYQANWLFGNWDPSSYESLSNEIVQHVMSGRSTRGLFVDKGTRLRKGKAKR